MVSVIIPYNKDRGYLSQAIESVHLQTYKDWELILSRGNGFCSVNLNRGLQRAKGEYIKILAEDDILPPGSLEILVKGIRGQDWIYADAENFGDLGKGWSRISTGGPVTLESMLIRNEIHGGTTLYKKSILFEVGGYDENLSTAEEYDLHLCLLARGYKHKYVPGVVYKYRLHGTNKSQGLSVRGKEKRRKYIQESIVNRYIQQ